MKMKINKYDELKIKYEALLEENKCLKAKIRDLIPTIKRHSDKLVIFRHYKKSLKFHEILELDRLSGVFMTLGYR